MGRRDRLQGVRLAELAVESLEGCAKNLGAGIHDLRALGWAWVGRARRLANDHAAADEAFARAEAEWCVPRPSPDPVIEAEILDLKSALRLFQRRFDEALELASCSIDRLRLLDEPRLLARALVGWANIMIYRGDEPTARPWSPGGPRTRRQLRRALPGAIGHECAREPPCPTWCRTRKPRECCPRQRHSARSWLSSLVGISCVGLRVW